VKFDRIRAEWENWIDFFELFFGACLSRLRVRSYVLLFEVGVGESVLKSGLGLIL
jgi:hypothetical protein